MDSNLERLALQAQFIEQAGWHGAETSDLAGDASPRRYRRLRLDEKPAVLMDAPPDLGQDTRPFAQLTQWLRAAGLSAPEILAEDQENGFLLLEDLGDSLYARHVEAHPETEHEIYASAVRLLVHLSEVSPPDIRPYNAAEHLREALLFSEWWLPSATEDNSRDRADAYRGLVEQHAAAVGKIQEVCVLRDYHAENLLWLPDRGGHARVGLLDYQDALVGHPAYDLMSLLEDARRDTDPVLRAQMCDLYLAERSDLDRAQFRLDYSVLGALRNLKIVGIFARLALRDGKPRYLELIPRVWGHVKRDLAHPELTDLRNCIEMHAPEPTPEILARIAEKVAVEGPKT